MMSWTDFYDRVVELGSDRHKAIWLAPRLDYLPLPIQRYDEPFLPLGKSIIQATQSHVGMYIFDFASYIATGAAGVVALERTLAYTHGKAITILHGPFTGTHYGVLSNDTSFNIDSLTVTLSDDLDYYLENPPYSAFLWNGAVGVVNDSGGVITKENVSLISNSTQINIPIIHSNDLLKDLTDTFIETIKQQVK